MPEQVICPGCEGWGAIRDGKASTVRCEVCKGEGALDVEDVEIPSLVRGVLLAIVAFIVVWYVLVGTSVLQVEP